MKNAVLKKTLISFAVIVIAVVCTCALFACGKNKTITIGDIFLNTTSPSEFTSYRTEFVLDSGWTVYTSSSTKSSESKTANSDVGYIKDIDGFVIEKNGRLSLVKCGDTKVYVNDSREVGIAGQIFPYYIGIVALRVKDGIIVCKFSNGEVGAFDYSGKTLISRAKTSSASGANIDSAIKILDGSLIAISSAYDKSGKSGYTSIYRPTTTGETRGELVCRVKNSANNLSYVNGFEGKYVSVVGNSEGDYMFVIPDHAANEVANLDGGNGFIEKNDKTDFFTEITYIGGGRFLVHKDWTVENTENYTYSDGKSYYVVERKIFNAAKNTLADYTANPDKIFLNLTNKYYDATKGGVDVSSYLKDGYMYASYGLFIIDKVAYYDQYILDENLNIVMSLTGNFGATIETNDKDEVSAFDLVMTAADGNYYVPYLPSKIAIYNSKGEKLGENSEYDFKSQNLANGVIIACIQDPDNSDNELYTLFDLKGNEITEEYSLANGTVKKRKYIQIAAFRGDYTIAKRENEDGVETFYLLGRDGYEVDELSSGDVPFEDMAWDTTNKIAVFKIGCYAFKATVTDSEGNSKTVVGVKNFNANASKNVIINATMELGSVLYASSSSPSDVFVFEKITGTDGSVSYAIHRLI